MAEACSWPAAVTALLCAVALLLPAGASAAGEDPAAAPGLDAAAWILIDRRDGEQLAARAASEQRSIASTTKLMTAYLALEDLRLGQRLTVPPYSPAPAESVVGLTEGERLTVRDLLLAMMLPSANDAAQTIAVGVAGSAGDFVGEMNRAAARLGLDDTSYANPIGLDDIGNYSSAADLAELATVLMGDARFRRIVDTPEAELKSGSMPRQLVTRNTLLLADPTVDGVKTGYTLDAGYVLVSSARREGIPLISVVLGADSESARDAESAELLDYGFSLYEERCPFAAGAELATAEIRYEDAPLSLKADGRACARARADQELDVEVLEAPTEVEGPVMEGEALGVVGVSLDGEPIGRVRLVAGAAVAAPGIVDRIGGPLVALAIAVAAIVILLLIALAIRRRGGEESETERSAEERMRSQRERTTRRRGGER